MLGGIADIADLAASKKKTKKPVEKAQADPAPEAKSMLPTWLPFALVGAGALVVGGIYLKKRFVRK